LELPEYSLFVGCNGVGKSTIAVRLLENHFIEEYDILRNLVENNLT
jgi:GTPase SAR1 family protein